MYSLTTSSFFKYSWCWCIIIFTIITTISYIGSSGFFFLEYCCLDLKRLL
uniref:Uncharacterized protein n=1 Tax=uncultured marine virus TaxID=186617 RepID=A0A0F7LAF6_9VIRU|nr:hypothetical protein [uncultured marine virus]